MTIVMKTHTIGAGEFKAKCLQLMDAVRDNGGEVIITKHGKPVAKLVPMLKEAPRPSYGAMRGSGIACGEIIKPIDVKWDAHG